MVKIGKLYFCWIPRWHAADDWESDPQYDAWGRGKLTEDVKRVAEEASLTPPDPTPRAGYVRKLDNTDYYMPCEKFSAGSRKAWIWYSA